MMSRRTSAGETSVQPLESAVLRYAREHPEFGQAKVARELKAEGYSVSPSGVRYIWQKHGLETTYKRLKVIAASKKNGGAELTSNQIDVLRRGDINRRLARKSAPASEEGALAERRNVILAVAAQLFGKRGYDGTSIRDIAGNAGLLPGSVYHYFASKQDLFASVHSEGFRQLIEAAELAISRGSQPWQRLELLCAVHIEALVAGNPVTTVTGASQFARYDVRLQRRLQGDRDRYEDIFRRQIDELNLPAGEDRSLLRLLLLGALNWTLVWYRPSGPKTPSEIAHCLVETIRRRHFAAGAAARSKNVAAGFG